MKNTETSLKQNSFYKKIRPKTEAVLTAFIAIALIFFSTYLVHIKSLNLLEEEIKIGLMSNVMSAATTIDGDIHKLFTSNTKRDDSLYVSQITPLENIRRNSKDIRYLYTNILLDDKVYFILNPSPQNDNDGDGFPDLAPALMEEYKHPAPELMQALKEKRSIVSNVYTDEWGIFVSAYAPFYNKKGEFIGTLGMDLELNNFYERLKPIKISFEKTVVIIIFIGLVIGLLIWYIRKHTQALILSKIESQKNIFDMTTILENTHNENISFLSKIKQTLSNHKGTDKPFPRKFYTWITHAIKYQKSKITSKETDYVDFVLLDFIKGMKYNLKQNDINLEIVNKVKLPFKAAGVSLELYIDAITMLLSSLQELTESTSLRMTLSQINEGVHDVTLQLEFKGIFAKELEKEFSNKLEPKVSPSDLTFNDNEFNTSIATQLLKQYKCDVVSFSNTPNCGINVIMNLSKTIEI